MTHITEDLANLEASIERQRRRIADGLLVMALEGASVTVFFHNGDWFAEAINDRVPAFAKHTGSSAMDALAQLVSAWNARGA